MRHTKKRKRRGEVCEKEYREITNAGKFRDIISTPEYARDDDGLGDTVAMEVLIYAEKGKVFADEVYLARNFRIAKIKARDTRRLRALRYEIPGNHTSLEEYQQAYRTYMNGRRLRRRDDEVLERKMEASEQNPTNPKPKKMNIPKKGRKHPNGNGSMVGGGLPLIQETLAGRYVRLCSVRAASLGIAAGKGLGRSSETKVPKATAGAFRKPTGIYKPPTG